MTNLTISRILKRLKDDLKIIHIARNWPELLHSKLKRGEFTSIDLRKGIIINSPKQVSLNFLFHEIWIDEFYAPAGYEIRDGNTVVDIGANIGVFALWAATRALNVQVYSYEPFPENAEFFRANVEASRAANIEFHPVAVADASEHRTLHVADSWILHSLGDKDSGEKGIGVDCTTLNEIVSKLGMCDLLKLDCEGGEYEVLYAASDRSLQKIKKIVCEFNVVDNFEKNGKALSKFLTDKGFVVDKLEMLEESCGFICARRTS